MSGGEYLKKVKVEYKPKDFATMGNLVSHVSQKFAKAVEDYPFQKGDKLLKIDTLMLKPYALYGVKYEIK